jgi:hypothetical protein
LHHFNPNPVRGGSGETFLFRELDVREEVLRVNPTIYPGEEVSGMGAFYLILDLIGLDEVPSKERLPFVSR